MSSAAASIQTLQTLQRLIDQRFILTLRDGSSFKGGGGGDGDDVVQ